MIYFAPVLYMLRVGSVALLPFINLICTVVPSSKVKPVIATVFAAVLTAVSHSPYAVEAIP